MPFGRFKGTPISDMDKKILKLSFKTKRFKQNPKVRKVFRKSTFGNLMKPEREYKDLRLHPLKLNLKVYLLKVL